MLQFKFCLQVISVLVQHRGFHKVDEYTDKRTRAVRVVFVGWKLLFVVDTFTLWRLFTIAVRRLHRLYDSTLLWKVASNDGNFNTT